VADRFSKKNDEDFLLFKAQALVLLIDIFHSIRDHNALFKECQKGIMERINPFRW
jgi:hypothetical protein